MKIASQALQVNPIESPGYILDNLGLAKYKVNYHKIYFTISIEEIENAYSKLVLNQIHIASRLNDKALSLANIYKRDIDLLSEDINKLRIYSRPNRLSKRGLINGLGSVIKYISGNLDQNDLNEIQNTFQKIDINEKKLMTEISNLHPFTGQITERWQKYITKIQTFAESILKELNILNNQLNNDIKIHIQLDQIQNLRNYVQILLRTISFSTQETLNVELIKQKELQEIFNYLYNVHSHDEIASDIPTLLEIIKVNLMFTSKILFITLKIPVLADELLHFSKIIPIPNSNNNILLPPYTFTLNSKGLTKWTNEECKKTFSFWYCQKEPHEDTCTLDDLSKCNFAIVKNNFSLFTQLTDGNTIICSKEPKKVNEDCDRSFKSIKISMCNVILGKNDCTYSFLKHTWMGSNKTFTQQWPSFQEPTEIQHKVDIKNFHLDEPTKLLPEFRETNLLPIGLYHSHIGITSIFMAISLIVLVIYLYRKYLRKHSERTNEDQGGQSELPPSLLKPEPRGRVSNQEGRSHITT